jgi:hypothetical protein
MLEDIKWIMLIAEDFFKNASHLFPLLNTSSITVDMQASFRQGDRDISTA